MTSIVGSSPPRIDAIEKVTGRAVYGTDMEIAGMLFGKILRSPVSHGRIKRIDTTAALGLPGIHTVITGGDLHDIDPYYGVALKDQHILAIDKVRYPGDPVAAVAAESPEAAEAALEHIHVEYEELPAAYTLDEALAEDAPLVHETFRVSGHFRDLKSIHPINGTNVCHHYKYRLGDVEAGFAQSEQVFEEVYEVPAVQHYSMEPYVVLAEADKRKITVWSATQHPFLIRKELAEIFRMPQSAVEVLVPLMGGAYGCKCYTKIEPLAVCLAQHSRRPVRLALTVDEGFSTLTRHGARVRVKTGVRKDGTIIARQLEIYMDTGAYADVGPRVTNKAGFRAIGPYRVPNMKIDSFAVYTNKVPAGAYRGYGGPQGVWAVECHMDEIADRLNLDPLAFRLRNLRPKGGEYAPGDTPVDGELKDSLRAAAEAIEWSSPRAPGHGKGLGCGIKDGGGTHTVSIATVRILADGSVALQTGSIEMGQGAHTVLCQIAAEELTVPLEQVAVDHMVSTARTPFDQGSSASRTTVLMGLAVQEAACHGRSQLIAIAAKLWGCPVEEISLRDGQVLGPDGSVGFSDLIGQYFGIPGGEIIGTGTYKPKVFEGTLGGAVSFWEIGAAGAEVAVDAETGVVHLVRYISVADAGRAIHPVLAEGQDEGGAMQGIGHTLLEDLHYEGGQLLNGNLVDYRVPTFEDLPETFGSRIIENNDGPGPANSKGVGESGVLCAAPAIGNAVFQATGVRIKRLPITPEAVWRGLREKKPEAGSQKPEVAS